jgi:nucleoid-associated protein YgaU
MERGQIISLSVGAGIVVVGGVLLWEGLLPGIPALRPQNPPQSQPSATAPAPQPSEQSANPSKSAPPQNVATAPPAANPAPAAAPKPAPAPAAPQDAKPATVVPQFDTVRVEPSGDTVVAGHGAPKAKVDLMSADSVLGAADADVSGDFVIVPQPLAPGTYVLALRSTLGQEPPVRSVQTITVNVPAKGQKGLVVALSEPGKPSKILRDPTADADTPPSPAPAATPPAPQPAQNAAKGAEPAPTPAVAPPPPAAGGKPAVVIKTAEVDRGGFYVAGMAPSGTHIRIYLNDSVLADVTADAKGEWSLTIGKGMTPGHYVVRADALNAKGKVVARAEVPFDVPVAVAAADQPKPAAKPADAGSAPPHAGAVQNGAAASGEANPKPAEENAANPQPAQPKSADTQSANASHAVVAEISTAKVIEGDSLWGISRKTLGEGIRYTLIYKANAKQIRDPDLIYPGQIFVVPH